MNLIRRNLLRSCAAAIAGFATTQAVGKPSHADQPILIDRYGFLHMGGWIRRAPDHDAHQIGDRLVLMDYDHTTSYIIVGRFEP